MKLAVRYPIGLRLIPGPPCSSFTQIGFSPFLALKVGYMFHSVRTPKRLKTAQSIRIALDLRIYTLELRHYAIN